MKFFLLSFFSLSLLLPLKAQESPETKATVLSHGSIILFTIDSVWKENAIGCQCYTSTIVERTKVEVDPGRHSFEFKYPKIGFGGRVYNATFNTEPGKTYEITRSDTNDYYPMVIDEATKSKLADAVIRQVSVQKAEAKVTKIPGIESDNYATVVSDCCDGFKLSASAKGTPLGNIIGLYKIDGFWGPNPMGFQVSFNSSMNGAFKILVPPGKHTFTMAIAASTGLFKTNKVSTGWLGRILDTDEFPDEVFSISAVLEAGKTYGFDYQLTYKNITPPYDVYHQVSLVEVPAGWKKEK